MIISAKGQKQGSREAGKWGSADNRSSGSNGSSG